MRRVWSVLTIALGVVLLAPEALFLIYSRTYTTAVAPEWRLWAYTAAGLCLVFGGVWMLRRPRAH